MRIKIGNKSKGAKGVYIGRPTTLGNPYEIGRDGTRDEVVAKYHADLRKDYEKRGPRYGELVKLLRRAQAGEELTLVCWCAPQACHGDVVKSAIEGMDRIGV
jgi:hypothetical protein